MVGQGEESPRAVKSKLLPQCGATNVRSPASVAKDRRMQWEESVVTMCRGESAASRGPGIAQG